MTVCFLLGRGRPMVNIAREQLLLFHRKGYTAQRMACHFGCSVHTGSTYDVIKKLILKYKLLYSLPMTFINDIVILRTSFW